jgi:hypothetical protein
MKNKCYMVIPVSLLALLFLSMPVYAEPGETIPGTSQIAPPLIREGVFAVKLGAALTLGTTENEVEAENRLSEVGILPKNGWMADYPVTPDIIGELYEAVSGAADAKHLSMSKDEALKRLNDVNVAVDLPVAPAAIGKTVDTMPPGPENFPDPSVVDNYYSSEGPPVYSYCSPPPSYVYLYDWIPYPFWWTNVWFPGYYILRDFHRPIFANRNRVFVSNHYHNASLNRFYRVNPVARFQGRTSTGTGVPHTRGFVPSGSPRGGGTIHHWPGGTMRGGRTFNSSPHSSPTQVTPAFRGIGRVSQYTRSYASYSPMYRSGGTGSFSSRGSITTSSYSRGGGGGFSGHSGGFSSHSGGFSSHGGGSSYRGGGSSGHGGGSGRGHR